MAENTKIEWCDHTQNFWIGCSKVSPACDGCYAEVSTPSRTMKVGWGPGVPRHRTAPSTWAMPKKWNDQHEAFFAKHGRRQRVFSLSLGDWLDNEVPIAWLVDMLEVVRTTPNLDWLLLTKRIGIWRKRLEAAAQALAQGNAEGVGPLRDWIAAWLNGDAPANVWVGATIPNQPDADRDIHKLLQVPAAKRFLSMEPLLGPVDLQRARLLCCPNGGSCWSSGKATERLVRDSESGGFVFECACSRLNGLDWVIVGGESGPGARPMHPDWARSLRDQCAAAGVPFFFKQWGEYAASTDGFARNGDVIHESGVWSVRVGKNAAGRLLDGREWNEVPS